MNELSNVIEYIRKALTSKFYGEIVLKIEAGQVVRLEKKEIVKDI